MEPELSWQHLIWRHQVYTRAKILFGKHFCRTGGSYYYHWMRDAGLSIKAWMDINDNDYEKVHLKILFNQRLLCIHPVSGCSWWLRQVDGDCAAQNWRQLRCQVTTWRSALSSPALGLSPSSPLKTKSLMVEDGAGDFESIPQYSVGGLGWDGRQN